MSRTPTAETGLDPSGEYLDAWARLARMIQQGRSFSGHERDCAFLNTGKGRFADVSAVTGLDLEDDGRTLAYVDWDRDGDLDLWIANRTGPRVRFFRNDIDSGNRFLQLRLEGDPARRTNRDAIGARVEVHLSGGSVPKLVKTLYGGHGFLSQSTKWLHFGLGSAGSIERVVVRWPGKGGVEELRGILPDTRCRIVQGAGRAELAPGPPRPAPLGPSPPRRPEATERARIRLASRPAAPPLDHRDLDGKDVTGSSLPPGPLLLNLWAPWCAPCVAEIEDLARNDARIRAAGLTVLALSVDGLGPGETPDPAKARRVLARAGFAFLAGTARPEVVDALETLERDAIYRQRPLPLPTSFLFDRGRRLAAIYKGRVDVTDLLSDLAAVEKLPDDETARRDWAVPFPGRWAAGLFVTNPIAIAQVYLEGGYPEDARVYLEDYLKKDPGPPADPRSREAGQRNLRLADVHHWLGRIAWTEGRKDEAIASYRKALGLHPDLRDGLVDLGAALAERGEGEEAERCLARALRLRPNDAMALTRHGDVLAVLARPDEAVAAYRGALRVAPGFPLAANNLAWLLATHEDGKHRNGEEALRLARGACEATGFRQPAALDTLAAAYAESGRFPEAVDAARKAVELAQTQGREPLAREIAARLAGYEGGAPFRGGGKPSAR